MFQMHFHSNVVVLTCAWLRKLPVAGWWIGWKFSKGLCVILVRLRAACVNSFVSLPLLWELWFCSDLTCWRTEPRILWSDWGLLPFISRFSLGKQRWAPQTPGYLFDGWMFNGLDCVDASTRSFHKLLICCRCFLEASILNSVNKYN